MAILINDVPVECINQAAIEYHVPAKLIISVLRTEGGHLGTASLNKNGTYDYGPMQINSRWLKQLAAYGYDATALRDNPCLNVKVGAWILGKAIASGNTLWHGVGNYHSHTSIYNLTYQGQVSHHYRWLNHYLTTHK